ncbi:DUF2202 domain-containing protein [Thermodesulfobacteriota bacterium]
MTKKTIPLLFISFLLLAAANVYSTELFGAKGAEQASDPSLEQMLIYAIQDEYLAHAEYEFIMGKYGSIRPFSNIIRAEETHIDMLKPLFEKYGFQVPENTAKEHIVVPKDLKEAFEIGIQAEIDNIGMYEKLLKKSLPDDVKSVFQRLKDASGNHLRAFKNGLKRY